MKDFQHGDVIEYYYNKTSWMTSFIFKDLITKFDNSLTEPSLLLLDNFSWHLIDTSELRNLELLFLPSGTTSRLQQLDQGIIAALKKNFSLIYAEKN